MSGNRICEPYTRERHLWLAEHAWADVPIVLCGFCDAWVFDRDDEDIRADEGPPTCKRHRYASGESQGRVVVGSTRARDRRHGHAAALLCTAEGCDVALEEWEGDVCEGCG
jgi:hypothetical protein